MVELVRRVNPAGLGIPRVPFCQTALAVRQGLLFISGQAPVDEGRNTVGETIAEQTRQVYRNLGAALAAHGCAFSNLVKITIFLRDPEDIDEFNRVPGDYYPEGEYPAATLVAGVRLVDPRWRVEIEAIAALRPA